MLNNYISGIKPDERMEGILSLCRVCGIRYQVQLSTVPGSDKMVVQVEAMLPIGYFWDCQNENRGLCTVSVNPTHESVNSALMNGVYHIFCDLRRNMKGAISGYELFKRNWMEEYESSVKTICDGESR